METPLPEAFLARLDAIVPAALLRETIASFSAPRPPAVRINSLKTTPEEAKKFLEQNGVRYETVPWNPQALLIPGLTSRDITGLELYRSGGIFIQSLSSMIPPLVLDPRPGEAVLDMAAAPGAKTTQIAALMQNQGELVANDVDRNRLFRLKSVLAALGVSNTTVTAFAGQSLWEKYPEHFDRVLLDAPCSMEGRFSTRDPASCSHWSVKKVKNLGRLQKWLLRSAVSCTKPGGVIVYSTCTLSPEENEEVVAWILEKEKGKIALEEISLPGLELSPGLHHWEGEGFPPEITLSRRVVPTARMEGFYVAKIRKLANNVYP